MLPQAADTAVKVDSAFFFIVGTCAVLLLVVTVLMVAFLVLYNRRRHPFPEQPDEEKALFLEVAWTVLPIFLVIAMFWIGYTDFEYIRNPPPGAMPVTVTGSQWSWHFSYGSGKESDVLVVPLGTPTELTLTSTDVIHSFYVPAFRIKEDCVPGMKTHLWFTPTEQGTFDVFCTEYCGVGHSHMRARLEVVPRVDFARWLEGVAAGVKPPGLAVMDRKGCLGCHSVDGAAGIGPTLKGIFGTEVMISAGGKELLATVDEDYLRRMITDPGVEVVRGFQPIMPKIPLTGEELDAVLSYLKGLK